MTTFTISGLRTELLTDPENLGYSGRIATGDVAGCAAVLNDKSRSGAALVWRNDIAPREIINVVDPANFIAAQQIQLSKLQLLFQAAPLDAQFATLRSNFASIFSGTASISGINAISQRAGSRAEELWGTGTTVNQTQVSIALS